MSDQAWVPGDPLPGYQPTYTRQPLFMLKRDHPSGCHCQDEDYEDGWCGSGRSSVWTPALLAEAGAA